MPELSANTTPQRIAAIDIVRGFVMLVMALDHVRDFFYADAATSNPTNLATTTPILFFTRWITHYCAPVFVFLAGTSAYLSGLKKSKQAFSIFLIKRGFWLILVDLVLFTFAVTLNPAFNIILFQVIWAIGCSMILLGLLVKTSLKIIVITGSILFLAHNILDYLPASQTGPVVFLEKVFLTAFKFFYPLNSHFTLGFLYAVLPWTGALFLGYGLGYLYQPGFKQQKRKKILLQLGIGTITAFILLRWINGYGDPAHWSIQKSALFTLLSFLNTSKYPCSLLYLCMTLGPAILALALLEGVTNKVARIFSVYGRVPLFYYLCHIYLIRLLNIFFFYASGYTSRSIAEPRQLTYFRPATFGFSLPVVYLLWLCIIVALYFPSRWYDRYKSAHRHLWWTKYV